MSKHKTADRLGGGGKKGGGEMEGGGRWGQRREKRGRGSGGEERG